MSLRQMEEHALNRRWRWILAFYLSNMYARYMQTRSSDSTNNLINNIPNDCCHDPGNPFCEPFSISDAAVFPCL